MDARQEERDAARTALREMLALVIHDPCTGGEGIFAGLESEELARWRKAAGMEER